MAATGVPPVLGQKERPKKQADLKVNICHKSNMCDKTRGSRKKNVHVLITKFVETTQFQINIESKINSFRQEQVSDTIHLEGQERAQWKHNFALVQGEHLFYQNQLVVTLN